MALFLLLCTDEPDARNLRAVTRPEHLAYLQGQGARVKLGGPTLDEGDEEPTGSFLVVEADDIEAVRAFAAQDPYARAGLFAAVEVKPWRLVVGAFGC